MLSNVLGGPVPVMVPRDEVNALLGAGDGSDGATAALARRNVVHHQLGDRVTVYEGSLYQPLPEGARYDLILANPPYVDDADMRSLPREFRKEPTMGLAGGPDGLELARQIIDARTEWLAAEGVLVCEVGMSAAALARAYPDLPFIWPEFEAGGEGVFLLLPEGASAGSEAAPVSI